ESRHDGHSFVFRDDELVSERWDSTIVKEKMKDMTKDILSRHPTLAAAIENADICFDWGVYSQPKLPSWISPLGKIVLLGDAAHASAPFMGQGGNMAMEDGWVLGKVLLNVKADGFSLLEALQRYESKRMSHCEGIVSKSTTVGGMNTSTGFKARLRNFMVPFMLKKMQLPR
ncbi:nicC, partial [Symbiodinium sp. KB8]